MRSPRSRVEPAHGKRDVVQIGQRVAQSFVVTRQSGEIAQPKRNSARPPPTRQ
jgi:hypothetical protein